MLVADCKAQKAVSMAEMGVEATAAWEDLIAIDGIGAEGTGAHSTEERIDLSTLPMLIERAAVLMYRLSRKDSLR